MPSHGHTAYIGANSQTATRWCVALTESKYRISDLEYVYKKGGSQPHNNMPPYLSIFIFQRIS